MFFKEGLSYKGIIRKWKYDIFKLSIYVKIFFLNVEIKSGLYFKYKMDFKKVIIYVINVIEFENN